MHPTPSEHPIFLALLGILLCCALASLSGCAFYGEVTDSVSRAVNPGAHAAYEEGIACQKAGKLTCGK